MFLAGQYPQFARSAVAKLFSYDFVQINAEPVKAGYKLRPGDVLKVNDKILKAKTPNIDLKILYEDKDVLVIDKPAGILSHSNSVVNAEASVASFIRTKLAGNTKNDGLRAGIVHRLDRPTSGVMICAKNQDAMRFLQHQFQTKKTKKEYTAIAYGKLKEEKALIDLPIKRQTNSKAIFAVKAGGKPSQTLYEAILKKDKYFKLKLSPLTGRTHQIRVHMSYVGCPIVGDDMYGGQKAPRLMLHANSLSLQLPSGNNHKFNSPLPIEMKNFWEAIS